MPDIVLYDRVGAPVTYPGADSITVDTPTAGETAKFTYGELAEGVEVEPDFSGGDQKISVPEGYLVREATIKKPEKLTPENIRYGEFVAGVGPGKCLGDTESIEAELDFSGGDMAILPSADSKVISSVTIPVPENLTPKNIKRNVVVAGILGEFEDNRAIFTRYASKLPVTMAYSITSGTETLTMTLPTNVEIVDMLGGTGYAQASTAVVSVPRVTKLYHKNIAISVGADGITITFTWKWTGSSRYYKAGQMMLIALYAIDGIELTDDGTVLVFSPKINTFPEDAPPHTFIRAELQDCGITELPASAFAMNTVVEHITLPKLMTSIGDYAFQGCTSLADITLPESLSNLGVYSFDGCTSIQAITIPDGVSSLPERIFNECTGLTGISLPDALTSIGAYAFAYCPGLTQIKLPSIPPADIGSYLFAQCTALTSLTIPDGWTAIPGYMVYYCQKLTEVNLPASLVEIGTYAFYYCSAMKSIDLPDGLTNIGSYAFAYCSSLTEISIPDSVTSLANNTFYQCKKLKTAKLPNGVLSIPDRMFYYCSALESITFNDEITEIGAYAFYSCTSLSELVMPSKLTNIGSYAFSNCSGLQILDCSKCESVPTLGTSALTSTASTLQIKVPAALYDEWIAAANWSTHASKIIAV